MKKLYKLFMILCFTIVTYAEEESIDTLLDTYVHNSDLSKKTRLHNAGNVTIFTRQELEKMQARNLRDIFKTLPILNYVENSLAIPDPVYVSHAMPFNSNSIRIYIDNQEVSSASYGSGLFYLGNIDLGFVDHIEVYTLNPSFEYSTEPARYLIKLYSKITQRDKGTELKLSTGTYGFNQQSIQYANMTEDFSYYTYLSRMDDKREKHDSFGTALSKDQERYFFFSTISGKGQHLQFQAMKNRSDMFMGLSTDGKIDKAFNKTEYIHIGYENNTVENLKLRIVYEKSRVSSQFKNNLREFELIGSDHIFTTDVQYKINYSDKNELLLGAKIRYKRFDVDSMKVNGEEFPKEAYNKQIISTAYFENYYSLNEKFLLSLGVQVSQVNNNAEIQDDTLWMARLGLIYTDTYWVMKTFIHRSEFLVEPYLYTTTAEASVEDMIKPEMVRNITQEIQYKKDDYKIRAVFGYNYMKNTLTTKKGGRVVNKKDSESMLFAQLEYNYTFNIYNTFTSYVTYKHSRNLYRDYIVNGFDEYKGVVRLLNSYGKIDLFNEVIYNYNSFNKKHYVDYSMGVKYHYSDALTFSLKGENIFDSAREDYFERGRRNLDTGEWIPLEALYVSPIDRKIYFTIEYQF